MFMRICEIDIDFVNFSTTKKNKNDMEKTFELKRDDDDDDNDGLTGV